MQLYICNEQKKVLANASTLMWKPLYALQYDRLVEDKFLLSLSRTHEKSPFCQNGPVFDRLFHLEHDAFHPLQGA